MGAKGKSTFLPPVQKGVKGLGPKPKGGCAEHTDKEAGKMDAANKSGKGKSEEFLRVLNPEPYKTARKGPDEKASQALS